MKGKMSMSKKESRKKSERAVSPDEVVDFELHFFEAILERKPDFVEALVALGDLYTKKGFYDKGLEIDLRLAQIRPEDPTILYNLACSYSLVNSLDEALAAIKLSIEKGYDDYRHLEWDGDLHNLRQDARFQKLLSLLGIKKTSRSKT